MRTPMSVVRGLLVVSLALVASLALPAAQTPASQVVREDVEGIRNFSRVDATVACAGATDVKAIAEVARRGYRAIVNLREASEAGAEIDASRAAADAANLKFIHLPLNGASPDPKVVDAFLAAVTDRTNQPVFINCGSANRVGALWFVKRRMVDRWNEPAALDEARAIGMRSEALEAFAKQYVADRAGGR
jgi:uncharacterized protein (TIGR01244 family)